MTYSGGQLVISRVNEVNTYDYGDKLVPLLDSAPQPTPHIGWSFHRAFSDCEVKPVTSGTRVDLVYEVLSTELVLDISSGVENNPIYTSIQSIIRSDTLLPEGGSIGFGLRYLYPRDVDGGEWDDTHWGDLTAILRGSDLTLIQTLDSFGMKWRYVVLYDLNDVVGYENEGLRLLQPSYKTKVRMLGVYWTSLDTTGGLCCSDNRDEGTIPLAQIQWDEILAINDVVWIGDPYETSPFFFGNAYPTYGKRERDYERVSWCLFMRGRWD
jgi:hypothetical protein